MKKKSETFSPSWIIIICLLLCCLSGILLDKLDTLSNDLRNAIFIISCFVIVWLVTTIYLKIFHKKDE